MKKNRVFKKNHDFVCRVIEGETILLPIYKTSVDMNCIYTLNESASAVWERINGKKTVAAIAEDLRNHFDTSDDEVEKELLTCLAELNEISAISQV